MPIPFLYPSLSNSMFQSLNTQFKLLEKIFNKSFKKTFSNLNKSMAINIQEAYSTPKNLDQK